MLSRIKLVGFKSFNDFSVSCHEHNVLVGPNNAGKSTILDAMRLASDFTRYSRRRRPQLVSQEGDGVCATHTIPHNQLSVPIESINRNYQDEPAIVSVRHQNGNELVLRLNPEQPAVGYLRGPSRAPRTTASFRSAFPIDFVIVPTLGPFETEERYVQDATVRANENTRLAHRNFRNIILRKNEAEFEELNRLLVETWDGLSLERPEVLHGTDATVSMMFLDGRIPRELHWAGFGFQVWLQMLLQLQRSGEETVLVLDEPDIYLHPDLQRKLLRLVRERFPQTFIATHSTEIINEAEPGDILSVDSTKKNARRVTSEDAYRQLFKYIGSSENAEFARVARAKRIVFFEGNDRKIVRKIAEKLRPESLLSNTDTVFLQAGGFGQWNRVVNTNWTLDSLFGMDVRIVALFDRDYRPSDEIEKFLDRVNSEQICARVLERKEIENYCLEEPALVAAMIKRAASRGRILSEPEAQKMLLDLSDTFKVNVQSNLSGQAVQHYRKVSPNVDPTTIIRRLNEDFEDSWSSLSGRLALVSGKEFISTLSARMSADFGVSITINQILAEISKNDVAEDLTRILQDFEEFFSEDGDAH